MMNNDNAIQVEAIGKAYRIGSHEESHDTIVGLLSSCITAPIRNLRKLKSLDTSKASGDEADVVWALRDISFNVGYGEVFGVIGHNGAGKSTLLKLLSRITEPTKGRAVINGRVASLLEVGTGFHPELSGRDNIYMNATVLGMTKLEVDRKLDEIIDFSGVERFLDTPIKRYSSGMKVRLAFSVAAHLDPEILIVDEVLAVGDQEFQSKCLGKMRSVSKSGRTVLFVSHNLSAVSELCDRVAWLDHGCLKKVGGVADLVSQYVGSVQSARATRFEGEADPSLDVQLIEFRSCRQNGEDACQFSCGDPICFELEVAVRESVPGLFGYMEISTAGGTVLLVSDTYDGGSNPLDPLSVGRHRFRLSIPQRILGPGEYSVYLNFTTRTAKDAKLDSPGVVAEFSVSDYETRRGNRRGGHLSTIVPWEILGT